MANLDDLDGHGWPARIAIMIYPLVNVYSSLLKMAVEIVSFPNLAIGWPLDVLDCDHETKPAKIW